jgi:hypothetical protein
MFWGNTLPPELALFFGLGIVGVTLRIIYEHNQDIREFTKETDAKIEEYAQEKHFTIDKRIVTDSKRILFDFTNQSFICVQINNFSDIAIKSYSDLIDVELMQDDNVIQKGGFGGALVGGALVGVVGAVAGSNLKKTENQCSMLAVRLIFNDKVNPLYMIKLIESVTDKNSTTYTNAFNTAQELYATFNAILNEKQEQKA